MKRRLVVTVEAEESHCGECPAQGADEHLRYCGVFRRPLPGTIPERLKECLAAEEYAAKLELQLGACTASRRECIEIIHDTKKRLELARGALERVRRVTEQGPRFTDRELEAAADSVVAEVKDALAVGFVEDLDPEPSP